MKTEVMNEVPTGNVIVREPEYGFVTPRCDIRETKDHYVLFLEMPGVRKDGLTVSTKNDQLLIEGKVQWSHDGILVRSEIPKRHFRRVFKMTEYADPQKVEATWMDGLLKIEIAKKESAKPREIRINFN